MKRKVTVVKRLRIWKFSYLQMASRRRLKQHMDMKAFTRYKRLVI